MVPLLVQVVCAVGAAESELGDFSAPRRIDGEGATRLVEAAAAAGVQQFVLVTSLGTGKIGFPAGGRLKRGGVLGGGGEGWRGAERSRAAAALTCMPGLPPPVAPPCPEVGLCLRPHSLMHAAPLPPSSLQPPSTSLVAC